ncbi:MAG: MarR family transcriptional regulator [Phycisphaerales bacterium]|nr:MarR family transcriptional regulator [Phycisphaerales bacterium]
MTWKEFDQNVISHSAAHHLMAIDDLIGTLGYARVSDIARRLGITRGSVSISLQPLKKAGLVTQDENRHLRLSEAGRALVGSIKTKRLLLKRLLSEVLGVGGSQAEIDACKIEHLVSNETAHRVLALLRFLDEDPGRAERLLADWRLAGAACAHRARDLSELRQRVPGVAGRVAADGPETDNAVTTLKKTDVIQELNRLYAEEIEAALRYFHLLHAVRGLDLLLVGPKLKEAYRETIEHAEVIARKIRTLGGVPMLRVSLELDATPVDGRQALELALTVEEAALEAYQDCLRRVEGDVGLEDFIRQQIAVESEHVAELKQLLLD